MARQNESLVQKKTWSEMTEEEQQAVRESWKHTLPEKFDVFCCKKDWEIKEDIHIPGNLYVKHNLTSQISSTQVHVDENFIIDGYCTVGAITVGKDFLAGNDVDSLANVIVNGNFYITGFLNVYSLVVHGNCLVTESIDSLSIKVDGLFYCYDVNSHTFKIRASDYACELCENDFC